MQEEQANKYKIEEMELINLDRSNFKCYPKNISRKRINSFQDCYLINKFISFLKPSELMFFSNNIRTLKIKYLKKNKYISSANYEGYSNVVKLIKEDNDLILEDLLFHELFHVSSTVVKDSVSISGFNIYDTNTEIDLGRGLNEGFTESLVDQILVRDIDKNNMYSIEKHFSNFITKIVGKNKMRKLYFSGDLKGLFKELEKYISEIDIHLLISYLDYINYYSCYRDEEIQTLVQECIEKSTKICLGIFDSYLRKNNKFTPKKLYSFFEYFDKNFIFENIQNEFMGVDMKNKYILMKKTLNYS